MGQFSAWLLTRFWWGRVSVTFLVENQRKMAQLLIYGVWLLYKISIGRRAVIGIKYTVRHTVQLAFYGTTGLIVGVTGLTLFENQLPLDYRNRIDHLKTQFLTNDIFEEHRIVLNIFGQSISYHPRSKVKFRPLTRVKLL